MQYNSVIFEKVEISTAGISETILMTNWHYRSTYQGLNTEIDGLLVDVPLVYNTSLFYHFLMMSKNS